MMVSNRGWRLKSMKGPETSLRGPQFTIKLQMGPQFIDDTLIIDLNWTHSNTLSL